MKLLTKLWGLSSAERRFAVRGWFLAPAVELSLHGLGIGRTLAIIEQLTSSALARQRSSSDIVSSTRGEQLIGAVYRRHFVRGECLPRAALQYGLHRLDGQDVSFVIGVRHGEQPNVRLDAHAWVAPPDADVAAYAAPGFDPLMQRRNGVHV